VEAFEAATAASMAELGRATTAAIAGEKAAGEKPVS